ILAQRSARKAHLDLSGELPGFSDDTAHIRNDPTWRVRPAPARLRRRHVDIGDLAPCDTERFMRALRSPAQGIQVDFDDGNCPTYYNQIKGIYNVYRAVRNQFHDTPPVSKAPVLMLRPRAWNMVEHNMMVNGKEVPGPLFDFGLLMFHNGKLLFENNSGPFFYLSKVESYLEARLWSKIFLWTEQRLGLPPGSTKATVLIENILATFEMEEILYELREHSAGLNCGIWDYSASFVNNKYVNMEKRFLRSYMDLLVQTCHRRGALATGGMAALLLPREKDGALYRSVLAAVTRSKLLEINAGVDGFMVYDLDLVEPMQRVSGVPLYRSLRSPGVLALRSDPEADGTSWLRFPQLFQMRSRGENQLLELREDVAVTPADLLSMPAGGVTLYGLKYNVAVGVLFIEAWLQGRGHFFYKGQVWQWIRHLVTLEDDGRAVTRALVRSLTTEVLAELEDERRGHTPRERRTLLTSARMFLEVVQKSDFPEFLTTYLNLDHTFLSSQGRHADQQEEGGVLKHRL
ncbi:malate synthase, glyoxysomal-like, partial [Scleropages formosus]